MKRVIFLTFAAAFVFMIFSCVSAKKVEKSESESRSEKVVEEEKKEEKETLENEPKSQGEKEIEGEKSETVIEEKSQEPKIVVKEWKNSAWKVEGENGAERISTLDEILVDGESELKAKIEIMSENRISILIEGLQTKKDVNTWSSSFTVSVQDSFGIEFILSEVMRDGKLILNNDNSALVTDLFNAGGDLVFLLTNEEKESEQYSFAVPNPEGTFAEALQELKSRNIGQ